MFGLLRPTGKKTGPASRIGHYTTVSWPGGVGGGVKQLNRRIFSTSAAAAGEDISLPWDLWSPL